MAEESEVFEITDFTTASEWERFIARLEEIIHEWKLDEGSRKPSLVQSLRKFAGAQKSKLNPIPSKKNENEKEDQWTILTDTIAFADFSFSVSYHHLKSRKSSSSQSPNHEDFEDGLPHAVMDMFDMEFDFPPRAHCLSRWFGLKEFLVVTPAQSVEAIDNESRCHLLLSSIGIAFTNAKCTIPMFIQAHQRWRRLYFGVCIGGGFRTSFEMSHLRRIPSQFGHLAGLLEIFKDKLACPISPVPPVTVSIRFTYVLDEWTEYAWPQEPPDVSSCLACEVGLTDLVTLPFGTSQDSISELHLSTTWPCLSEEVVVDNAVYSDLDPLQAPQWCVRVRMTENPQCLLGEYIGGFMRLCHRRESTLQLLRRPDEEDAAANITHALQKITEPTPGIPVSSLSSAVTKATSQITTIGADESPLSTKLLEEILKHLFPDAESDPDALEAKQQGILVEKMSEEEKDRDTEFQPGVQERFRGLKTAPEDSLTFLLAISICIVNHSYGGLRAVAHLWQEFILEMRYRWENNVFIPRLKLESPNLGCCIIHQKLQMLNCCIERRRLSKVRTHGNTNMKSNPGHSSSDERDCDGCVTLPKGSTKLPADDSTARETNRLDSQESSADDEDEFFEAIDSQEELDRVRVSEDKLAASEVKSGADEGGCQREGALKQFADLMLLETGEPLYVPITQEPAPMTEDMLQEQADILFQLGTSREGARVRAQMQCASLLSDMEAFKAANPGCLLEDFVRWYSPNDWITGPETEEELEELKRLGLWTKNTADKQLSEDAGGDGGEAEATSGGEEARGWDVDDDEVTEEDLIEVERSSAKTLMEEAKSGNLPEIQARKKWCEDGHLSLRMRTPGNMWAEVWHSARPAPVRRQKRLFDETKEAEKVLHYLTGLRPAEVAFQLFPVLLHAAVLRIEKAGGYEIPGVSSLLDQVISKASRLSWIFPDNLPQCEDLAKQLQLAELVIARAQSLRFKFRDALLDQKKKVQRVDGEKDIELFLSALVEKPEVTVIGAGRGPAGRVIRRLFAKQESARLEASLQESHEGESPSDPPTPSQEFPAPTGREYILRTTFPHPRAASRPCPQRMYCVLTNEFRVAGAFTDDVTFQ